MNAVATIVRAPRTGEYPFFQTARQPAQDRRLSAEERGVLWFLLSKHDDWKIINKAIQNEFGMGRTQAGAILKNLREKGYIVTETLRSEAGRFMGSVDRVYEIPKIGNRTTEKPESGEPRVRPNRSPANRPLQIKESDKSKNHHRKTYPYKKSLPSAAKAQGGEIQILVSHQNDFSDYERYAQELRVLVGQIGEPAASEIIRKYKDTVKNWAYFVKAFQSRIGGSGDPIPHSAAPLPQEKPSPLPPLSQGEGKSLPVGQNHLPEVRVNVGVAEADASVQTVVREGWTAERCWQAAYEQLSFQLDKDNFNTWVSGAKLVKYIPTPGPSPSDREGSQTAMTFVIRARTEPARVRLQNALYRNLRRVVSDAAGGDVELVFEVMQ